MEEITKRYKYRIYPNKSQREYLAHNFGFARYAYNWALAHRTSLYQETGNGISHSALDKAWNEYKPSIDWLDKYHSSVVAQQTIQDLDKAFSRFFQKKANYPRFKKKSSRQSMSYTRKNFSVKNGALYLPKNQTPIKVAWSRDLPDTYKSVTITQDSSGRYFASFPCLIEYEPFPKSEESVGIDLGIKNYATMSDGSVVDLPKSLVKINKQIARAQRNLSKKKKGSANRTKARIKLAKLYARQSDIRNDFLHKLTTSIVRENQVIAIEDLDVKGLYRINGRNMNQKIQASSFNTFRVMLKSKAEQHNRECIIVDRYFPSSKMCNNCYSINHDLKLSDRNWTCSNCNTRLDRDLNASLNILARGMQESINAHGDNVILAN